MPIRYVVVFQKAIGCEPPPFIAKIETDTTLHWITEYGLFPKAVCSTQIYKTKKAAVGASKTYKKTLAERDKSLRHERSGHRQNAGAP